MQTVDFSRNAPIYQRPPVQEFCQTVWYAVVFVFSHARHQRL